MRGDSKRTVAISGKMTKELAEKKGFSQEVFAKRTGCSLRNVKRIFGEETAIVFPWTLAAFAKVLEVDSSQLQPRGAGRPGRLGFPAYDPKDEKDHPECAKVFHDYQARGRTIVYLLGSNTRLAFQMMPPDFFGWGESC
jgi:transcriptional regulator with XRE-family HTH domain